MPSFGNWRHLPGAKGIYQAENVDYWTLEDVPSLSLTHSQHFLYFTQTQGEEETLLVQIFWLAPSQPHGWEIITHIYQQCNVILCLCCGQTQPCPRWPSSELFLQPKLKPLYMTTPPLDAAPKHPYPELHVCPLAEPLLPGLGGGEDRHLLPIQLQNARVLVPHHLREDRSHRHISHLRSDPPSSRPLCSASPKPALSKGNAWTEAA